MHLLFSAILAFLIAVLATRYLVGTRTWLNVFDHPNERSLHNTPVPRTGGTAIVLTLALVFAVGYLSGQISSRIGWLAVATSLVASVSLVDDLRGLALRYRLIVHLVAATLLAYTGLHVAGEVWPGSHPAWPWWLSVAIGVLTVVWMINLYNFMDGMDGFAGGMAVIGFGALGLQGWLVGANEYALINLVIVAAAGGFLVFNFPPARIFMGDTGSATLGLMAATMALWGARDDVLPLWASLLVFSPFIVDATMTLIRRISRGERFWMAHRTHYYQRLVQMGWGHRKTVLVEYGLMVGCAVSVLVAVRVTPAVQWGIITIWAAVYTVLMVWVDRLWSRHCQNFQSEVNQ